ncbi:MAG: NUDIX domain-containing protein [Chloroflexota bacterium]
MTSNNEPDRTTIDFANKYPNLFQKATWPRRLGDTMAQFKLDKNLPPTHLISTVHMAPRIKDDWVLVQFEDGTWEYPGGGTEPSESYLEALKREMMEEAGAVLRTFQIIGAWYCHSLANHPRKPHMPHPDTIILIGTGEVELVQKPTNPDNAEQIVEVACVPLEIAIQRFLSMGRKDVAELYQLAAELGTANEIPIERYDL